MHRSAHFGPYLVAMTLRAWPGIENKWNQVTQNECMSGRVSVVSVSKILCRPNVFLGGFGKMDL